MRPEKNGPRWKDEHKIIIDDFGSSFLKFCARCAVLVLSCSGLAMLLWVASPKPPGPWTVVLISIGLGVFLAYGMPWVLKKANLE